MKLTAYNQFALFEELQPEWNDLVERSITNRIFSTWEWQSTWWQAYQPGELWVITCRDENNRLIGIAPWFIESNPQHGRVVRSIGCVEVTDYLDIIVDATQITPVLAEFATFAAQHGQQFDLIDLCNLPEYSPALQQFPDHLRAQHFEVTIKQQEVCPVIALPSEWEAYLEALDKKQRHELRRKIRRAEGADEKVAWYIVDQNHDLNQEIERFLHLMASSQAEKAGFLQDPQNIAFFKSIVPIAFERGWLQMSFLTINGEAAAAYINFTYDGHVLVYNSGLLPNQYGHLSPGIVLLAYNIQHAIQEGQKVFDFLRGDENYKYRMGGQDTRVFMLIARKSAG
ncbi:MAG: GNAT family N-acetyltransferase [Anaerolineae bacterium]|nr:GNAT family N-acetyltransferase [Anaerolineae bacterium]